MSFAYIYQEDRNPEGFAIPGVPLRSLTPDDVQQLPRHLRRSVAASPLYRKTVAASAIEEADQQAVDKEERQQAAPEPDSTPSPPDVRPARARAPASVSQGETEHKED